MNDKEDFQLSKFARKKLMVVHNCKMILYRAPI